MTIKLDNGSLALLGALHHGCRATLEDDGTDFGWRLRHRRLAEYQSMRSRLNPTEKPTQMMDVTFDGDDSAVPGSVRRVDEWKGPERDHSCSDGLRLIRSALAKRDGNELVLTPLGHGTARKYFGHDGVDFERRHFYGCAPIAPKTAPPADLDLVDALEDLVRFPKAGRSTELRISQGRRGDALQLEVALDDAPLTSLQSFGSARTMIAMLGDAGKAAKPVEADFGSDLTLAVGGKDRPAWLTIEDKWRYAVIDLPAPLHRLFREYLRENIKRDGDGITMRPVDVAWHSFDATWDQIID